MNSTRSFRWQDNRGFALIFLVVALPLILLLFLSLLRFSRFIERKIKLQNGIDAAILSGATVLAEGLNQISRLNLRLEYYHRLYATARAGTLIHGGVKIAEIVIRKKIEAIALKQEFIKIRFPILATQKTVALAKKNGTPNIFLFPLQQTYPIQRDPPRNGLPNVYRLSSGKASEILPWQVVGHYYRSAYKADSKAALFGTDLLHETWRGYVIE